MRKGLKKTLFIVLAAIIIFAVMPAMSQAAGTYVAENVSMEVNGVPCMVDFLTAGTATIWRVDDPDQPTAWAIPESLTYDNVSYPVTRLSLTMSSSGSNITSLTLPSTLEDLDGSSFRAFSNLTELTIPGSVKVLDASFQYMRSLQRLVLGEGIEEIRSGSMVSGCSSLTEIVLPDSLRRMTGTATFSGATALTSLELPEGVEITEGSTFSGCTALQRITLPASVQHITGSMFSGCTALQEVEAAGTITEIGSSAFAECTSLVSVPDLGSVTKIESYAFYQCYALSGSLDLSQLTEVGSHAFEGCYSLSGTLDLSNLRSIPTYAFAYYGYYNGIDALILGSELEDIGNWAFTFTTIQQDVVLPDGIERIDTGAFYMSQLGSRRLTIPDSVTALGSQAFEGTNLTEVYIGSGLDQIPGNAFAYCQITNVTINSASDDITVPDGTFPADAVVVYLIPSIGDVGETIEENGQSIRVALAQGGTVELKKDVKLSSPLTIPSGTNVTLTSQGAFTLISEEGLENLIVVEKGATLTLAGDLKLSAHYVSGSAIVCHGTLYLQDAAAIQNAVLNQPNTAVIDVSGSGAKAVLSGGSVAENKLSSSYSAPVRVSAGATLEMTGGQIQHNSLNGLENTSSAGVLVYEGGSFTMTGGSISQNNGLRGSGVMVLSNDNDAPASFNMSGGSISQNTSSGSGSGIYQPSGAVHVEGYAAFTLSGSGTVSGNSVPGGMGGGVCVVDPGIQQGGTGNQTAFVMTGGTISGNNARTGGGVYSYTNGVRLQAGHITDNTASNLGGGVYSEGNASYYSTLYLENALITGNEAEQGGGMWFCATGETTVHAADGAAIFGNEATDAGADFAFALSDQPAHTATLANNLLGGGSVEWYHDGRIYLPIGGSFYPSVDVNTPRYGQAGADTSPVTVQAVTDNLALKAVASQQAQAYAQTQAALFITGNEATYGGGVGANGGITIGSAGETKSLTVTKQWSGDDLSVRPDHVDILLKNGGTVIDSRTLTADADQNWTYTFTGLPQDGDYSICEVSVPGYTSAVSGSAASGQITVTNTFITDAVMIRPADVTIYMGGEHGYSGVVGESGVISMDTLPVPGFIIELPDVLPDLDISKVRLQYEKDGVSCSWKITKYGPGDHNVFRIEPVDPAQARPVHMVFTDESGSSVVTDDGFDLRRYINQNLKMKVYGADVEVDCMTLTYGGISFPLTVGADATLRVRGAHADARYGDLYAPGSSVPKNVPGVAAPADTLYTINESPVQLADTSGVALLFDDIIEANSLSGISNTQLMKRRVDDTLADSDVLTGDGLRHYQLQYLDLVDRNNGNAWVVASEPVTVYWPLPNGTDEDTQFVLLRFEGLHREMSAGEAADISGCEVTEVPIVNDGSHLRFTVEAGGFAPFALVWETPDRPGGSVTPSRPDNRPHWLNTEDHYAYIIGYPDGNVHPSASITRAEVATIFFRLLTDEARDAFWCETNSYKDVAPTAWYNNAVSTLSRMGILGGYEDGTFRPNAPITRSEFAKIAVSFFDYKDLHAENIFDDVPAGSWYESFVAAAAKLGLIEGYGGNVYHPEDSITRAEACTIINRTLRRAPDRDHLLPEEQMITWPDNRRTAWYYAHMQEATNSHDYRWAGDLEVWTGKLPERDWEALEHTKAARE